MNTDAFFLDSLPEAEAYCIGKSHELEIEMERAGVALGIDWDDEVKVLLLAREALNHMRETVDACERHPDDLQLKAKMHLFAISYLMTNLMAGSAVHGIHTHGGAAWNAFSHALARAREENA